MCRKLSRATARTPKPSRSVPFVDDRLGASRRNIVKKRPKEAERANTIAAAGPSVRPTDDGQWTQTIGTRKKKKRRTIGQIIITRLPGNAVPLIAIRSPFFAPLRHRRRRYFTRYVTTLLRYVHAHVNRARAHTKNRPRVRLPGHNAVTCSPGPAVYRRISPETPRRNNAPDDGNNNDNDNNNNNDRTNETRG